MALGTSVGAICWLLSAIVPAAAVDADDREVIEASAGENDVPIGHDSGTDPTADLLGLGLMPASTITLFIAACMLTMGGSSCVLTEGGRSSSGSSADGMPANGSRYALLVAAAADDREVIAPAELEAAADDCEVLGPAVRSAVSTAASQSDCHARPTPDEALVALAMLRDAIGNSRSSAKLGTGGRGFPTALFPLGTVAAAAAALSAAFALAAVSAYDNPDIAFNEGERLRNKLSQPRVAGALMREHCLVDGMATHATDCLAIGRFCTGSHR